jgi:hypothetical protein
MGKIEEKLTSLGYRLLQRNSLERRLWIKGENKVRVVYSSEYNRYMRILWREEWKDYYAIIYDYSRANGPTCIIPVSVLYNSPFVKEKRTQIQYAKSGNWWSQRFPKDHKFRQLVLSYKERWDLL